MASGGILASTFNGSTEYMCHNGTLSTEHTFKPCGVEGKEIYIHLYNIKIYEQVRVIYKAKV